MANKFFEVESAPGTAVRFTPWPCANLTPELIADSVISLGEAIKLVESRERKPKRSKWHRVEDELPSPRLVVLCYTPEWPGHQSRFIGCHDDDDGWQEYDFGTDGRINPRGTVTHWRELPKPPKE
jgi:hypothetical protein